MINITATFRAGNDQHVDLDQHSPVHAIPAAVAGRQAAAILADVGGWAATEADEDLGGCGRIVQATENLAQSCMPGVRWEIVVDAAPRGLTPWQRRH